MIITESEPEFWSDLTYLGRSAGWHSPQYTFGVLNYYKQLSLDNGKSFQDQSFIFYWSEEPVAAFIGAISKSDQIDLLAYEVPCCAIENRGKMTVKASKAFILEFDKILEKSNGKTRFKDYLINGNISFITNYLLKKGAIATPFFSKVIDLSEDKSLIWRRIRKSYSSLINNGLASMNPKVVTSKNVSWEYFVQFRELHIREAGRETRSIKSWQAQYKNVQNSELVSAGYFSISKINCYYGVSASRRDLFGKPLFHSLLWVAILHAKKIGCRWFEIGDQSFDNYLVEKKLTNKEINIVNFKAGFSVDTKVSINVELDKCMY